MVKVMSQQSVKAMAHLNFPSFLAQLKKVNRLDTWTQGRQKNALYSPRQYDVDKEYRDLAAVAPTPWLALVVQSLVQTMFVEGIRMPGQNDNLQAYDTWQENRLDSRQISLYRSTFTHGLAFASAMPATSAYTNTLTARYRLYSAKTMAAFYNEDDDEHPAMALECRPYDVEGDTGWNVTMFDELAVHSMSCKGDGQDLKDWSYIGYELHGTPGTTPIVRYGEVDLDGNCTGQVEPLIPLAGRIDQDTFDRLIVQRFGSWRVRYATGLVKPKGEQAEQAQALLLRASDLLVSPDVNTKFGTLDASDLAGFIAARDSDLRDLSAVSQTPPHHMLGLSSNLQAEALNAASAGLQRKSAMAKTFIGEGHETLLRLGARIVGNEEEARAFGMQVRWRDTETRSLAQVADALGKLATQVGIPVEMLWARLPEWSDADTERAKGLLESGGIDELLAKLSGDLAPAPDSVAGVGGAQAAPA